MAKVLHRIFEIYESLEEATRALTPRLERTAREATAPESWTFEHLAVTRSTGVTHVQFKEANDFNEATIAGLRASVGGISQRCCNAAGCERSSGRH